MMRPFGLVLVLSFVLLPDRFPAQQTSPSDSIQRALGAHALPLHSAGEALLLSEARQHDFFLLGELHGENEIPLLLRDLWPPLWASGYRHVGAEVSPWAADHLQEPVGRDAAPIVGLWTREQADRVRQFAAPHQKVLWGCDIEEAQPGSLIQEMARQNPNNPSLEQMSRMIEHGYNRQQAAALLDLAEVSNPTQDARFNGLSLWRNLRDTLLVEKLRATPETRLSASDTRETVMKELFLAHYRQEPKGKVLLRFGRNHLHRGYDARGISTLGNFVAEWALAERTTVFNVGVFAAGGKEHLAHKTWDADERQDEPTFALLASLSKTTETLFDLRPLRPLLHSITAEKRSSLQANLTYWADSYDFLLCYPVVSPLGDESALVPPK